MPEKRWVWCRNLAVAAVVVAGAIQFAPSDLIATREQMLRGLVGSYGEAQWTIACTPTNAQTSSATADSDSFGFATSKFTSATVAANVPGETDDEEFAEGNASYSGTWTFTWNPVNNEDWPPDYTITSVSQRSFQARVKNGTGSSRARYTGESDLVLASLPNSGTSSDEGSPVEVDVDTTDSNLTIRTITHSYSGKRSSTTEMVNQNGNMTTIERSYKAAWFQQHFNSPYDIVLTFNVDEVALTARADFDADADTGVGSAMATASEVYTGR